MGRQVAIVGEGNNEITAFQQADVSMCMMSGTAIAKQHCDMVLCDNDFKATLHAVMWGRNIYTNIKRFL